VIKRQAEVLMSWLRIAQAALAVATLSAPLAAESRVAGAWHPEVYTLEDGTVQEVTGLIFFTDRDWTVLFFTLDGRGGLTRGAGEGGTYTLEANRLVFTHLYHLSGGSTPLKMSVKSPGEAEVEPCRIELEGEALTIYFPSGNKMRFRKSSS
jgi:hypothetical protein